MSGAHTSAMTDWASLPPELVQDIAYCVLSTTGGVDTYMDMRAVCPNWRSAIAKPPPLASIVDFRFRPRNWVMVDLKSNYYQSERLFLHVPTGRFRRLSLPMLRGQIILGASDGLIVLTGREQRGLTCVLNPLRGDMLHFPKLICDNFWPSDRMRAAVSGGPNSTLVVWLDREWEWHTVLYADQTSAEFTEEATGIFSITSMVTFQGNIYLAGQDGPVLKFVRPAVHCDHELVVAAQVSPDVDIYIEGSHGASSYLVESGGELLLVRHRDQALKVFRFDAEQKLLEEVKTMGCRALFLGGERCLSVDANMLPSVDADCIYMSNWVDMSEYGAHYMHVYNLRDGTMEILFSEPMLRSNIILYPRPVVHVEHTPHGDLPPEQSSPRDLPHGLFGSCEIFTSANNHRLPPLSLIQVLLNYCNDRTWFND